MRRRLGGSEAVLNKGAAQVKAGQSYRDTEEEWHAPAPGRSFCSAQHGRDDRPDSRAQQGAAGCTDDAKTTEEPAPVGGGALNEEDDRGPVLSAHGEALDEPQENEQRRGG